jgi:hypothetical protein
MNKLIEDYAIDIYGSAHHDDFMFAELIIKECINIVANVPLGYADYRSQIEEDMQAACIEALKYKFGIKPC